MAALTLFVFDYASGGAPAGALPASLRHQGQMILRALQADLAELPGVELVTLGAAAGGFRRRFEAGVQAADAVWPLAPEAGGLLERLSRHVLLRERVLLGSRPAALRVAASKLRTAHALARAGVAVAPAYAPDQALPPAAGAWVVKPDDGAGCVDSRIFPAADAARAWILASGAAGYVLQPFIPGKLGSLSLLCRDGAAELLACNEQRIAVRDNQFHFLGTTVNSIVDTDGAFARLAQAVATAIPGLWGHVGVDFVLGEQGIVVLEVHAQATTAYAGLRASLGCNPAELALDLLDPPAGAVPLAPAPARPRAKPVAVSVDVAAFGGA